MILYDPKASFIGWMVESFEHETMPTMGIKRASINDVAFRVIILFSLEQVHNPKEIQLMQSTGN